MWTNLRERAREWTRIDWMVVAALVALLIAGLIYTGNNQQARCDQLAQNGRYLNHFSEWKRDCLDTGKARVPQSFG